MRPRGTPGVAPAGQAERHLVVRGNRIAVAHTHATVPGAGMPLMCAFASTTILRLAATARQTDDVRA